MTRKRKGRCSFAGEIELFCPFVPFTNSITYVLSIASVASSPARLTMILKYFVLVPYFQY
jgi:hypothetical protein